MANVELASLAVGTVVNTSGAPMPNSSAFVYAHGTTTPVSVYVSEFSSTTISQPLSTDQHGQLPGWVAQDQRLDVVVLRAGVTYPPVEANPIVAGSGGSVPFLVPAAVGDGVTDDSAAWRATVAQLDPAHGGTIMCRPGKTYYLPSEIVLPRLTGNGRIIIDLNGSTLYTDQGNRILSCLVSRALGHDPTDLLAGCVDWEIRNGMILGTNQPGSRGIQIEASYNLRFAAVHFSQLEVGEEVRFGLMHADEDCRYTNCGLAGFIHGSGEAVGHFDTPTAPLTGATIACTSTLGFDNAGQFTVYTDYRRTGPTRVIAYTSKTPTSFTGCTTVSGSLADGGSGSVFVQTLWAGASTADGCNAATHKGRHYCAAGQHFCGLVTCTDGHVIEAGSIFEGNNPIDTIRVDGGGLTTSQSSRVQGEVHVEHVPSNSFYYLATMPRTVLEGLNTAPTGVVIFDARWDGSPMQVLLRDHALFGASNQFRITSVHRITIENCGDNDFTQSSWWVGGVVPDPAAAGRLTLLQPSLSHLYELMAFFIDNAKTGNNALIFQSGDSLLVQQDDVQFKDAGGTNINFQVTGARAIGFYGVTPVARQLLATGAAHTVDDVIGALQALGLLRQT